MAETATPDITSEDLDLLRAIQHESQQSRRGVTAEMCAVLSNCTTPAQREAVANRMRKLLGPPLRLLRVDPDDHERVWLTLDGRQVLQAAPWSAIGYAVEPAAPAAEPSASTEDSEPGHVVPCCDCLKPLTSEERHYYAARCERCESAVSYDDPKPETLVDGTASSRVEVTTLQVAIHPPGTYHEDPGTILLTIEDEGHGPYVAIRGMGDGRPGGVPVEIESLATLDALRAEAARLLCQVRIGEDES